MRRLAVCLILTGVFVSANVLANGVRHHPLIKALPTKTSAVPLPIISNEPIDSELLTPFKTQRPRIHKRWLFFYAQADVGVAMGKIGKSQSVVIQKNPLFTNGYSDRSQMNHVFAYAVHAGLAFELFHPIFIEVGAGYYRNNKLTSVTHVTIGENLPPIFKKLWFEASYAVQMYRIMGEAKIFFKTRTPIVPYITGGIGRGCIAAEDFHITKLGPNFDGGITYKNKTVQNMVWQAGGGIDILVFDNLGVNVEYRYVDYGKAKIGPRNKINSAETPLLDTGSITTHEVVVGINYLV